MNKDEEDLEVIDMRKWDLKRERRIMSKMSQSVKLE